MSCQGTEISRMKGFLLSAIPYPPPLWAAVKSEMVEPMHFLYLNIIQLLKSFFSFN